MRVQDAARNVFVADFFSPSPPRKSLISLRDRVRFVANTRSTRARTDKYFHYWVITNSPFRKVRKEKDDEDAKAAPLLPIGRDSTWLGTKHCMPTLTIPRKQVCTPRDSYLGPKTGGKFTFMRHNMGQEENVGEMSSTQGIGHPGCS